jgi:hypothetical protein
MALLLLMRPALLIRKDDFAAPQHGAVMVWLLDHSDQWTPGTLNFADIQRQLEVAGLADKIGQGHAAVLDLLTIWLKVSARACWCIGRRS